MVRGHQYLTPSRRYALVLLLVVAVAGWMPLPSWGQVASKFFRVKYNTWFLQLSNPCTGVPLLPTDPCWLRRIVLGNSTSTSAYYAGIGATNDTFNAFKSRNGFNTGGDVQAVYFNEGDRDSVGTCIASKTGQRSPATFRTTGRHLSFPESQEATCPVNRIWLGLTLRSRWMRPSMERPVACREDHNHARTRAGAGRIS